MTTPPHAQSWLASANEQDNGFPLGNLPFCAFTLRTALQHLGIGIGNQVLDLHALAEANLLPVAHDVRHACLEPTLNSLMALGHPAAQDLRQALQRLLAEHATTATQDQLRPHLHPMADVAFAKPVAVPNYTDFYASLHHATNVGRLFRPDQPLLPNYKWVPIGYHGRASSLVVSDTPIQRPHGQIKPPQATEPTFGPTQQLDFELELAAYIASGNPLGHPIPIADAPDHIWGYTLLNDWSARDLQAWEYQPLGPFLGKNFATTVSPWVIPAEALAPFPTALAPRDPADPQPLPYLQSPNPETAALDLTLEVHLTSARMRDQHHAPIRLTRSNPRDLYWTFAQLIAHHTSNGCNLQPGDLLATGTISGPTPETRGCLLEITQRGAHPLTLPTGETRTFLHDGDQITLTGYTQGENLPRITLGQCRGQILPARQRSS